MSDQRVRLTLPNGYRSAELLPAQSAHLAVVMSHWVDIGIGFVEPAKGIHISLGNLSARPGGDEVERVGLLVASAIICISSSQAARSTDASVAKPKG